MEITERKVKFSDSGLIKLLNYDDSFINILNKRYNSILTLRGNIIIIKGDRKEIKIIESIFKEMEFIYKKNNELLIDDISSTIEIIDSNYRTKVDASGRTKPNDNFIFSGIKDLVRAKSKNQQKYFDMVKTNDLVFSIGPAGTGKTFLAVAMALAFLRDNRISKIIISRPAVEAGESLGFLPGDLSEKLDPYLRPITDALYFMIGPDKLKSMIDKNIIEITPLAYMRGRTLNNAFIILDEAQNTTITQMKMFLTRIGANSKAIVTGDITQIDLSDENHSGLVDAKIVLAKVSGISFVYFNNSDIVRHKLVAKIINAYETSYKKKQKF